jgi:acyl-CoA carboxylase subunit alpha
MRKLLIANRGEIACRVARTACTMGIRTVAVYSEADRHSPHVAACDEALPLGGVRPDESYLVIDALLAAARRAGADAVHPGYGFLSENARFAAAVSDAGLCWVGPPAGVIEQMGDKLEAKKIMQKAGVPVLPSRELGAGTEADLAAAGRDVGYPLLVKAAAGGGGKGMRLVEHPEELADSVASCRREAGAAFGDDRVFLERFAVRPRHVEVQIFGDAHGRIVHLFERECSIQRRHQKILEESPSPGITAEVRQRLCAAAVEAGHAIGYQNAGTVEFVVGESGEISFLEVNTRLQVEHPVTELVTGQDLVRWQLEVAAGRPLPLTQEQVSVNGHAIEVRLYAEDPAKGFLPAPGIVHAFEPAPDVRWDSGVAAGSEITAYYDPLLAKVTAVAPTREQAAGVLAAALRDTVLHGPATNRDLLEEILVEPAFLAGDTTTDYIAQHFPTNDDRRIPADPTALRAGAVAAALSGALRWNAATSLPAGWRNSRSTDVQVEFDEVTVEYRPRREGGWLVTLDGGEPVVCSLTVDGNRCVCELDGHVVPVVLTERDTDAGREWVATTSYGHVTLLERPRFPTARSVEVPGAARAPMPGSILMIAVEVGERVDRGQLLCVIESMKMEQRVLAPHAGVVESVAIAAGEQVTADQVLLVVREDEP